jgi:hypothetical protein
MENKKDIKTQKPPECSDGFYKYIQLRKITSSCFYRLQLPQNPHQ